MRTLLSNFRNFAFSGSLVDLAVGLAIGAAFATVVESLVGDVILPLVAAVFGEPSFGDLSFTINGSEFRYGHFLNALITFLSVATAVFFFVLKPAQRFGLVPLAAEVKDCPHCTTSIPAAARRCPQCTAELSS